MPRRGTSNFKINDLRRVVSGVREQGIEPVTISVITKDGTEFRVTGNRAPEAKSGGGKDDLDRWIASKK